MEIIKNYDYENYKQTNVKNISGLDRSILYEQIQMERLQVSNILDFLIAIISFFRIKISYTNVK